MKSIFIYNGSRCKESRSLDVINKIRNQVKLDYDGTIEFNYYDPITSSIKNCSGCSTCFKTCKCKLDDYDDMKKIRQDMIKSDFIIFASPVYAHNVSGDMKIFIDRISYWLHYMKLFNKKAIILVSNADNGGKIVIDYLYKIISCLGVSVVSAYENRFDSDVEKSILDISNQIIYELNVPVRPSRVLEERYELATDMWRNIENSNQHRFLKENKFFEYKSYEDLLINL
uniref:NADPH-dependent FMN reductase-like domain-containing protein n=1 Tax=Paraclostridium sordellii TaxID=1505 RepID=A0A2I6SWD1_PARSO|nr:NAD(P)H-dependent oxidoreductase [Paeniclostridium sordellii]AUO31848.1 hypothetical protein [Paeniclostridium sordellii]